MVDIPAHAEPPHALASQTTSASKGGSGAHTEVLLNEHGEREEFDAPEWVLERIVELMIRMGMYPFARKTTSTKESNGNICGGNDGGDSEGPLYFTKRLKGKDRGGERETKKWTTCQEPSH